MQQTETKWEKKLQEALFSVELQDVYVGPQQQLSRAPRWKAIVRKEPRSSVEPFAIVTNQYRLIRNDEAMELGYEAFGRVFGAKPAKQMTVFNVMSTRTGGSFLADLTSPALEMNLSPPSARNGENGNDGEQHRLFLRVVNSYNRTQALRIEIGVCRWICRNGMIFGKRGIRFKDAHAKKATALMDEISRRAIPMASEQVPVAMQRAYLRPLPEGMDVLEGAWQALSLKVPEARATSGTTSDWQARCEALVKLAKCYESKYGRTTFSALQSAAQWVRDTTLEAPLQRSMYERRCGERLEAVQEREEWGDRDEDAAQQTERIREWEKLGTPTGRTA